MKRRVVLTNLVSNQERSGHGPESKPDKCHRITILPIQTQHPHSPPPLCLIINRRRTSKISHTSTKHRQRIILPKFLLAHAQPGYIMSTGCHVITSQKGREPTGGRLALPTSHIFPTQKPRSATFGLVASSSTTSCPILRPRSCYHRRWALGWRNSSRQSLVGQFARRTYILIHGYWREQRMMLEQ